jgi:transcriptional regulator with XRE-family HTH domain
VDLARDARIEGRARVRDLVSSVHNSERLYTMEDILSTKADNLAAQVGHAVRQRRVDLGLSLRAVAAKSKVSASMISDIERGTKYPTISTLAALAEALGVRIATLIESATPQVKLVRRSEQHLSVDPKTGARRASFGPAVPGSKVEFLSYTLPPHVTMGPFPAHSLGTIEHVHLVAGAIRISFGNESVALESGDSCSCYADAPHQFDNSDGAVEALIYLIVETASR